jgi:hypothetical protein
MDRCPFCNKMLYGNDSSWKYCTANIQDNNHFYFKDNTCILLKLRDDENLIVIISVHDKESRTSVYINDEACRNPPIKSFDYEMTEEECFKLIKFASKMSVIF